MTEHGAREMQDPHFAQPKGGAKWGPGCRDQVGFGAARSMGTMRWGSQILPSLLKQTLFSKNLRRLTHDSRCWVWNLPRWYSSMHRKSALMNFDRYWLCMHTLSASIHTFFSPMMGRKCCLKSCSRSFRWVSQGISTAVICFITKEGCGTSLVTRLLRSSSSRTTSCME